MAAVPPSKTPPASATAATDASDLPSPTTTINIGTRRSRLALIQTDLVITKLQAQHPTHSFAKIGLDPLGDRDKATALYAFNAKSLWTSELEELLAEGGVDLIVHSLKDMPTLLPAGMVLAAVLEREDPRDALVLPLRGETGAEAGVGEGESGMKGAGGGGGGGNAQEILNALPEGSIIGTSSLRRTAQLRRKYPHLRFADARGNVPTRLRKLDLPSSFPDQTIPAYAALVVAAAGLVRLGLGNRISAFLSREEGGMLHAVGQGAIGVEAREGDERIAELLRGVGCWRTERECLAERSFMRTLEGGCSVPLGVETRWLDRGDKAEDSRDVLSMHASVTSVDGTQSVAASQEGVVTTREEAEQFGERLAQSLVEEGAAEILEKITRERGAVGGQSGSVAAVTAAPGVV